MRWSWNSVVQQTDVDLNGRLAVDDYDKLIVSGYVTDTRCRQLCAYVTRDEAVV